MLPIAILLGDHDLRVQGANRRVDRRPFDENDERIPDCSLDQLGVVCGEWQLAERQIAHKLEILFREVGKSGGQIGARGSFTGVESGNDAPEALRHCVSWEALAQRTPRHEIAKDQREEKRLRRLPRVGTGRSRVRRPTGR